MAPESYDKPSPAAAFAAASSSIPLPPTPRSINVQKFAESRALEIRSLHDIVSTRLNGDFRLRRDKRRRTTGHKASKGFRHRSKRQRTDSGIVRAAPVKGAEDAVAEDGKEEAGRKKLSRRARRRMEFQENPVSGFVKSGDGTRRLRTHLWHAKRFTMVKQWGFYLPLGLHGRGRGSRALLKRFKCGALIHDASYCLPIQLEGPKASLLAILKMVLIPSSSGSSDTLSNQVAHGVCYENAMLCYPGDPPSKVVAPIMYMWQPFPTYNNHANVEQDTVHNTSDSFNGDRGTSLRKLLMWIHIAAFNEALDVLNSACQKQMDECGITVRCCTLEGQLTKMEVIGSKATELLKQILVPMLETRGVSDSSSSSHSCFAFHTKSTDLKSFVIQHAEQLPSCGIMSLTVHDPRELPSNETEFISTDLSASPESDVKQDASGPSILSSGMSADDAVLSLWSQPEINGIFLSESEVLWNCSNTKLYRPIPESILCKEKHHQRLKSLYLEPDDEELSTIDTKDIGQRYCPILLLKHGKPDVCVGWSIILPLCWLKAFWNTLIARGAHAIGLRERRWVACNTGLPSFPFDFPDCKAYSSFMADEAVASDKKAKLRPLALRPFRVPIPPPWHCIASTIKQWCNLERGIRIMDGQSSNVVPQELVMDSKNITSSSEALTIAFFPGFVARTSKSLDVYVRSSNIRKFLSMPEPQRSEKGTLILAEKDLCFVRVLLRAFKEGVFEEGALVCAPLSVDLSRWATRSEEHEEPEVLQTPQSLVRSCFMEQESGRWELQFPEDCSSNQSFRWPIGFVTTGFVYGSSKPVAVAYVEANLLSMLREQQFQGTRTIRHEIFLFVRNMRSTTYRRALATVVLEKHRDDLEFM